MSTQGLTAVHKSITVTTNDPKNRQILLTVTAAVQPEFILSDRIIFFGSVPRGTEAVKSIVITISTDEPVKLLSAESTDASFAVRLEPVEESNGKRLRLTGFLKSDAKEGYHFGMLVVKTTSSFTPELRIPVRGTVVTPQGD